MRRAFGDHIFDNYVKLKRKEWDEYRVQLTQWELDRYLRRALDRRVEPATRVADALGLSGAPL